MQKYRIGFIGCGEIAHMHAACLLDNGALIAGGYDFNEAAARQLADRFGGKAFADPEQLCQDRDVDAVYICTRHDSHVQYVTMAARNGKAIFCEKPLAMNAEAAAEAVEAVEKYGVPCVLGFNHRYSPGIAKLKQYLLEHQEQAQILHFQFVTAPFLKSWAGLQEQGGGVLVCLGSHVLDLVHYLAPSEVVQLQSMAVGLRLPSPYLEDAFGAVMTNEAGQFITVQAHDLGNRDFSTDPAHRINTVQAFIGDEAVVARPSQFEVWGGGRNVSERYRTDVLHAWGYQELNKRFLQRLSGENIDVPDVYAGWHAAKMVEKCRNNR
ncbi:Gfo/Idh/MocA family protein [Xylanibacillus composti]|uniref:Gfo/Idh/MocA family oxidoreductase n=1 Tax=Xylanibacillus composti TaxID=1572762 RepID=A0A8J4H3D2_9BACL|nr:Gfo/Idh/MocA family oxidoreductase [Xylanibacillus composti]GIQ68806.1 hypothetical protein XYCOK13_16300 [Xylanibacillus composti]